MRRSVTIAVAVLATLILVAGSAYVYGAVAERIYISRIADALDEMLQIVKAEGAILDLWSSAVNEGYREEELPADAANEATAILSRWRNVQSEVAEINAPARHQRSYDLVVTTIDLRIGAIEALIDDPMSEEYDRLWAESQEKMVEYQRVILEEVPKQ